VYTDGGVLCNCPLQELIQDSAIVIDDMKEILCTNIGHRTSLTPDFQLSSFLFVLFSNMMHQNTHIRYIDRVHYINVEQIDVYIFDLGKLCQSSDQRIKLIQWGENIRDKFLQKEKENAALLYQKIEIQKQKQNQKQNEKQNEIDRLEKINK
jgi:hypothetical protein